MTDAASNYTLAYGELRRRLVLADKHRLALPGEPRPGWRRRRARAQTVALLAACALAAIAVSALDDGPALRQPHPWIAVLEMEVGR